MNLKTAIQKITDDYDVCEGETADPAVAVQEARDLWPTRERSHQEVNDWGLDTDLTTAYHTVIDASDAEITRALT